MPDLTEINSSKFWSNIARIGKTNEECWLWLYTVRRRRNGKVAYPRFVINNFAYSANRIAYYLHYQVDPDQLEVAHRCNNTICCNPNHLYLATHLENMSDASKDSLFPNKQDENNDHCKLTEENVRQIRWMRMNGLPLLKIANFFNISATYVDYICKRKNWVHVN
jgi:hypothetical protein